MIAQRRGRATVPELKTDFPDLNPSDLVRVLDALEERGLVQRSGDPALRYWGAVDFWPTSRSPSHEDEALDALVERLLEAGWAARAEYERGLVVVGLPLAAVHQSLFREGDDPLAELRALLRALAPPAGFASVGINPSVSMHEGKPAMQVELGVQRAGANYLQPVPPGAW